MTSKDFRRFLLLRNACREALDFTLGKTLREAVTIQRSMEDFEGAWFSWLSSYVHSCNNVDRLTDLCLCPNCCLDYELDRRLAVTESRILDALARHDALLEAQP